MTTDHISGAIVFLTKDHTGTLMLENILFDPAAAWLSQTLQAAGVARFLVVCHQDDRDLAASCFPPQAQFVTTGDENAPETLSRFLDALSGQVLVFTAPVFLTDAGAARLLSQQPPRRDATPTGVFPLSAAELKQALDQGGFEDFESALEQSGQEFCDSAQWAARSVYRLDSRLDLMDVQAVARRLTVARLVSQGVRVIDPEAVYVGPNVQVGGGTVLLPGTILRGSTTVGQNCEIGPNTMIRDCTIGDRVTVNASQLNESVVDSDTTVGPFAYIRPNCHVGPQVKVGDFVELKNSTIGQGTKISHLTYVGDADVGGGVNFGCGTVTVNYDGHAKFRTTIGDGAFIGCNTNLVAPVQVGDGAYTAAGSTITDDVPADALAIARSFQTNKRQWAAKRRKKQEKK
jgi:bifunctional UDP-N-acetylglucosamine pyrophosphorylase/glucosamine-1-phosphate N-acetyltransferase